MSANITRTAQGVYEVTRLSAFDMSVGTSAVSIVIPAEDLKAALWEPDIFNRPPSPEKWGGWSWAFQIFDGSKATIKNDDAGGIRWNLWVHDTADTADVLEALLAVIAEAGFQAEVVAYMLDTPDSTFTDFPGN